MPLVTGAVLPHGGGLIQGFEEAKGDYRILRDSIKTCSKMIMSHSPDTIVLVTPHNLRIRGHMGIINAEHLTGVLSNNGRSVKIDVSTDRILAERIYFLAERKGLPAVLVNYGTDSGDNSRMPLDWGAIIPLYFLNPLKSLVLITPSREIPWIELVKMGNCIDEAACESEGKVAFIASADQAHAHSKTGPYGYNAAASRFDKLIFKLLSEEKLNELIKIDKKLVENAKPDSLWQMLILAGALQKHDFRLRYIQYDCPSYYGMLMAVFY
jgi:aromatic ring-opening dioxygenase LigB subunit